MRALNRNMKPPTSQQTTALNEYRDFLAKLSSGSLGKAYKLFSLAHVMGEALGHTQHPWGSFLGRAMGHQITERGSVDLVASKSEFMGLPVFPSVL